MEKTQLEKKGTLIENMLNAIECNLILFDKVKLILKEIEMQYRVNVQANSNVTIKVFVSYKNLDQIDRERVKNYLKQSEFEINEKQDGFNVILNDLK